MIKYFLFIFLFISVNAKGLPKEYYKLNGDEKKEYFFRHLEKIIDEENKKIIKERALIKRVISKGILGIDLYSKDFIEVLKLRKKYNIKTVYILEDYLKKIDIVPPSQALAQAAVESGWGESRFVKEANNIFGHWTYGEKGLIPENRDEDATHKIRIFKTLNSSVANYMLNLNRNRAYRKFREKRFELRKKRKKIDGLTLSQTMTNYSGIGKKYLEILKDMINQNSLSKYDKVYIKN